MAVSLTGRGYVYCAMRIEAGGAVEGGEKRGEARHLLDPACHPRDVNLSTHPYPEPPLITHYG